MKPKLYFKDWQLYAALLGIAIAGFIVWAIYAVFG